MSTSVGGVIEQALDRLGIDYELRGDEAWAVCPMHEQRTGKVDHHPSWSINLDSGVFFCFSCRYRGKINRLIQDVRGVSRADAEEFLGEPVLEPEILVKRLSLARHRRVVPVISRVDEAEYLSFPDPPASELEKRGLSAEIAEQYTLRYDSGWLLPIRTSQGDLVGWQYKHNGFVRNRPPGVRKSLYLFGMYEAVKAQAETVAVVEAPLDAALSTQYGTYGVATYGAMVSEEQINILAGFPEVIVAMDNPLIDKAGRIAQEKIVNGLQDRGAFIRVVEYPEHIKDFGDAPSLIPELITNARNPLLGRLHMLARK